LAVNLEASLGPVVIVVEMIDRQLADVVRLRRDRRRSSQM